MKGCGALGINRKVGKARRNCESGVTDSEGMGVVSSMMFNRWGLKKVVLFKKDVVSPNHSTVQGMRNVCNSFKKV